uniref:Uncharacterized protein n=1 Tax=Sarcophilus harrisii TaxID=9305 RepID=A0A7N4NU16_SARHA
MWCDFFSLYRRVLNTKMMYIYKRPYVHFPRSFLRQNCDHMCIIKVVFNPLPMEIFWKKKKLALYIQFLKDKESALYFV